MAKPQQKFNICQHVTETILAEMEAGTVPWRQPWSGGAGLHMPRRVTGQAYQGINVVMLWLAAAQRGYDSTAWMTYRQALDLGGQVRKGEKFATVVKFGKLRKEGSADPVTDAIGTTDATGAASATDAIGATGAIGAIGATGEAARVGEDRYIPWARAYRVFNCDQIDGLDVHWYDKPDSPRDFGTKVDPVLSVWFASLGVPIGHSAEPEAYYEPARDRVHMPPVHTFESQHGYFHTLAHESAHATGASHRLDRQHSGKTRQLRYAQEELVAEISSAMICARLGVQPTFAQNAAYLKSWIAVLKESNRAIVKAASMAQAAADWMFETAGTPDRTAGPASGSDAPSGSLSAPGQGVSPGVKAA